MAAYNKQELQEVLEEWKGVFKKHGLTISREKTEVMWMDLCTLEEWLMRMGIQR